MSDANEIGAEDQITMADLDPGFERALVVQLALINETLEEIVKILAAKL